MPTVWLYLMPALCNSLALIKGTQATAYTHKDYPNPLQNPAACGMDAPGYICDPAHILSQQQVWSVNTQLAMVSNATAFRCDVTDDNMTSSQGFRISVAVVPRVRFANGHYPVTAEDQLQALTLFAEHLHNVAWHFGNCGEHAVLVLSAHSHKILAVLGDKVAAALPPSCAKVITDGTHDLLVGEQFATALEHVLTRYRAIILGEKCKYGWSHWYTAAIIVATGVTMVILYCAAMACNNNQSGDKRNSEKLGDGTANGSPVNGGTDHSPNDSSVVLVATEENLSSTRDSLHQDAEDDDPRRHIHVKRSVSSVGDYGKRHVSRHHPALNIDKNRSASNSASNSTQNVSNKRHNVGRSSSSASAYGKRRPVARRESTFSFVTDFRYKDGSKASSLSLEHLDHLGKLSRENSRNAKRRSSLEGKEAIEPLQRSASAKHRTSPAVRTSPLLLV